jgi:hypothetical protein
LNKYGRFRESEGQCRFADGSGIFRIDRGADIEDSSRFRTPVDSKFSKEAKQSKCPTNEFETRARKAMSRKKRTLERDASIAPYM